MSDNLILPSNYKKEIVLPAGYKKVWEPIAESQKLALSCPAQIILLQGTRASGKTDVSLMRFRRFVGIGYGEFWRGIVYDVSYRALDDIVNRAKRWFSRFNDGSKFYASKSDYKYVWKTGEELLFRSISTKEDYENSLHGQELCLGVAELVNIKDKGDIEIQNVCVGDEILTSEGYKKITRVFPIKERECNNVLVFNSDGTFIGSQVQSVDHSILNAHRTFSKHHGLFESEQRYLLISSLIHASLKSHLCENQETPVVVYSQQLSLHLQDMFEQLLRLTYVLMQWQISSSQNDNLPQGNQLRNSVCAYLYSCYFHSEHPNDEMQVQAFCAVFDIFQQVFRLSFQTHSQLESKVSYHLNNKTFLNLKLVQDAETSYEAFQQKFSDIWQQMIKTRQRDKVHSSRLLRYSRFHRQLANLRSTKTEFSVQYALSKINQQSLSTCLLRLVELLQQEPYSVLDNDQPLNVSVGQEITTDYLSHCLSYHYQYGELPLTQSNIVQDIALQSPDELKHNRYSQQTDGLVCEKEHNLSSESFYYTHPYSQGRRQVEVPFEVHKCVIFSYGIQKTIDIEVDDTNNYITSTTGLSNKNCFISPNELTKHPTSEVFDLVLSTNRSSFIPEDYPLPNGELLPQIPLTVLATTNSSGIGRNWVKRRFIDKGVRGEIVKVPIEIFNPRTQEQEIIYRTQTHIFSSYKENTKLTPEYIAQLESIEDPIRRAQWLLGSWDNDGEGGRFDYIWESKVHVIEPFDIPKAWKIDRSFDYGSSAPFSVLWFAESDGCDIVLRNGKTRSTIKGDIFLIHEWAGCDPKDNNKGLRMLATDIAKGIIERELMWGIYDRCVAGNADNAIWNVDNGNCIASDMQKPVTIGNKVYQGVTWTRSDKSSGSRVAGWERIAEYLVNAKVTDAKPFREKAGLFIFNVCDNLIEVFPYLQRDDKNPDDIETKRQNDHCADALRYKIYGLKTGSRSGKTKGI